MSGSDQDEDHFDAKVREQADERIGILVGGKYKIIKSIGVGGMGAVYEAEHELIGKRVALKCLHHEYARDRDLVERFKREARAATAIGNEHIVDVTDMGDLPDGAPFLVMEMLKGMALADLMDTEGVLPIGRSVKIVRQICFALQAAHDKGIVHRDMKPENVFLAARSSGSDFVKVLDFGISKMHEHGKTDRGLTRTGIAMGTPSYMSPEQAQGAKDVDPRTDIWAVGVMLYEMLTLRRPFEADSYPMMLMAIVGRDPEPVRAHRTDVPEALDRVILQTLIKPVGLRTQTMADLAELLLPFAEMEGRAQMTGQPRQSLVDRPSETRAMAGASEPSLVIDSDGERLGKAGTIAAGTSAPPPPAVTSVPPKPSSTSIASPISRQPTPATRAGEIAPRASEASPRDEKTGVIGSTERKTAPTGEIGVVERRGREATSSGAAVPMQPRSLGLIVGVAVAAIALLGIGTYAMSGPGAVATVETPIEPPVETPLEVPPVETPSVVGTSVPVAPAPTEVAIQITTSPGDARVELGDVEFPNPLSAHRPRSLDPITIRISAEGYETVERLAIFDHDQSFMFQLAPGRGVRREGMDGRVAPPHGAGTTTHETPPRETPPPETTPPSGSGGFRDDF